MNWLGLDTTTSWFSAAISGGNEILVEHITCLRRSMLKRGDEMIETLFRIAGLGYDAVSGIAVGTGPGSYTGLRVGMGLAQGLQLSLGVPLVGVKTSQALASQMQGHRRIIVAQDAGRRTGHVVLSIYDGTVFPPEEKRPPSIVHPPDAVSWYTPGDVCVGGAASRYVEMLGNHVPSTYVLTGPEYSVPRASVIARIGRIIYESGWSSEETIPTGVYLTEPPKPQPD